MSVSTGLASALAALPGWFVEGGRDWPALEASLGQWLRAAGWKSVAILWPANESAQVARLIRVDGRSEAVEVPAELKGAVESLTNGAPTVVWQVPGTSGKLYASIQPHGRVAGAILVEKGQPEAWSELERGFLQLSARLIERTPAMQAHFGPSLDAERLAHRLSDASTIAGRMAHDFDNVLTGMIGFADLTAPLLPSGSQAAKYVAQISEVGKKGVVFTQQLHQMSRAGQAKPLPGSIAMAVSREESRLRPAMPVGLTVAVDIPADLGPVGMDTSPLSVAIGHLLENAVEASGPHGRIDVAARIVELSNEEIRDYLGILRPGTYLEISLADRGIGVKPEARAKLFGEPFYTTKVRHRGLGLAIVYRAVSAHGGGIKLEHRPPPETGVVARVVLPPAAARAAVVGSPRTNSAATLGAFP